ncbi:MAG: YdcF family protein [Bacteroidales bacterium]
MIHFIRKYILLPIILMVISNLIVYSNDPDNYVLRKLESNTYDAIIVPGVPYNDPNMSKILLSRIYWSHYLYSTGQTKNIIFSGSAVYTPYIEAEIMSQYAQKLGVPAENIYIESQAEHSVENVYYSYKIAKKLGFKRVALATDPLQNRMLKRLSKKLKVEIDYIPFSFDFLDSLTVEEINIVPDKAYVENFVAIQERESFFKRLRGTMGKNIKLED